MDNWRRKTLKEFQMAVKIINRAYNEIFKRINRWLLGNVVIGKSWHWRLNRRGLFSDTTRPKLIIWTGRSFCQTENWGDMGLISLILVHKTGGDGNFNVDTVSKPISSKWMDQRWTKIRRPNVWKHSNEFRNKKITEVKLFVDKCRKDEVEICILTNDNRQFEFIDRRNGFRICKTNILNNGQFKWKPSDFNPDVDSIGWG
jgi:hypothetical protein